MKNNLHYFDGVFVGPPVPLSVFYKGKRPGKLNSFKKPHEIRTGKYSDKRRKSR